ncbi:MAG: hypothetical protein LQ339_005562 [Xanthoria mediterranea]|nr:MAG: hypothetical protein LQ339_005562 [Xanthoria mediterranea]
MNQSQRRTQDQLALENKKQTWSMSPNQPVATQMPLRQRANVPPLRGTERIGMHQYVAFGTAIQFFQIVRKQCVRSMNICWLISKKPTWAPSVPPTPRRRLGDLARLQRRWNTVTFVTLPLTFTKGSCTISLMHAERPAPILESPVEGAKLEQPRDASVAVVEQCVGSRGKGGYTLTGQSYDWDAETEPWNLAVHVYHPQSQFKKFLDLKYACDVDAEGKVVCHSTDEDEPQKKRPTTGDDSRWGAGVGDPGQVPAVPGTSAPVENVHWFSYLDILSDLLDLLDFLDPVLVALVPYYRQQKGLGNSEIVQYFFSFGLVVYLLVYLLHVVLLQGLAYLLLRERGPILCSYDGDVAGLFFRDRSLVWEVIAEEIIDSRSRVITKPSKFLLEGLLIELEHLLVILKPFFMHIALVAPKGSLNVSSRGGRDLVR